MTRYFRLFAVQLRISIATAVAYRANFLVEIVMEVLWTAITLLPLIVLFDQRREVAGWDQPSMLIVLGYFYAVRAVLEGTISPSLALLVQRIRDGSFDYVLLKPVDAQVQVSTAKYEPARGLELVTAVVLIVYAFIQRGVPPDAADVALGVVLFATGVMATYALWIVCAAAAFWVGRLDNLMYLLEAIFDVGRWPVTVFRGVWRTIFTFVIPIALMTTFPAKALLGSLGALPALATVGGALVLLALSRLLWRTAIRNYTSASS
ncbi:MAG TPA: ABC-2 family transporter protein [Kofleriaceae bacterium]|nr:ABC-2 family transporter protein [Kofleriaceae bacterium]